MYDSKITRFQKKILSWIAKKIVTQGFYHQSNIVDYFSIIKSAAENEFTEDNQPTLNGFLDDCYNKAMGYNDTNQHIDRVKYLEFLIKSALDAATVGESENILYSAISATHVDATAKLKWKKDTEQSASLAFVEEPVNCEDCPILNNCDKMMCIIMKKRKEQKKHVRDQSSS